ncbi:MAG: Tat pathway signal protein [Gemmatimonadota bacterium]
MQRRGFIGTMSAGVMASRSGLFDLVTSPARFSAWTWVHGGGDVSLADWRARYARIRAAGITGVLVGGGDSALHTEAAHAEGLVLHRWTWALNRNGDTAVQEAHPEWFSVSREGNDSLTHPPYVGYYRWLCPTRRPVREYLAGIVDAVAATDGIDAVHLDYIRHPDVILPRNLWEQYGLVQDHEMAAYDFCYCEVCRERFERESGRDPLSLADPTSDVEWRRFRWRMVTETVQVLAGAVHGRGKAISAAVFPTPTIARKLVRQEWDRWPLDIVFPMIYHGFYREPVSWIEAATAEGVAALPNSTPLISGVYLPDLPASALGDAMRAARRGGARGVSMFEMNGLSNEHLAMVKQILDEN